MKMRKTIAPGLTRRRPSVIALCLALALWCTSASAAAAQKTRAKGQGRPAKSTAVDRLDSRVVELYEEGKYTEAIPLAERAVALKEKRLGPRHPSVANSLNNLAALYESNGDYNRAEPLHLRALGIREKALGLWHVDVAQSLSNLGLLYFVKGDLTRAEPLYRRALAIYEKAYGHGHPDVALSINNLARVYESRGDYGRAESLYRRALAIYEKVTGEEDPSVAGSLNNLGALYVAKGDYALAEPYYLSALGIREKGLGPEHPSVAESLNNLAELYYLMGEHQKAEPLYRRALAIYEKAFHPDHPSVAIALSNLALLYYSQGELAKAGPLYQRSLAVSERAFGAFHPSVAGTLNNLAEMYRAGGDYVRAEQLHLRALEIREKALGPEHPSVAESLNNLAGLFDARRDYARAVQFQARALEVQERNTQLILTTGSERQKLAYLAGLAGDLDATISLHARSAPSDALALRLALTAVLLRKGRTLDAMSDQVASLRRTLDTQDHQLLDQLTTAQSELSSLILGGPVGATPEEHREAIQRLKAKVERLQDELSRRSVASRIETQPVTVETVQGAIPQGAALVEFFSYRPFDARARNIADRFGAPRYVVYVLRPEGEPLWADLGEAAPVNAEARRLLAAIKCPQKAEESKPCPSVDEIKRLARSADELVMRPVRRLLGTARHVFVSADAALNLLPFAALVDEEGRYLVESHTLTYLTSGRDLLRQRHGPEYRQQPLIIAAPSFSESVSGPAPAAAGEEAGAQARRSAEMGQMKFDPLPGTADEAMALSRTLAGARVLTQGQATEAALKQVAGPRVLHVATHGFFLPNRQEQGIEGSRGPKVAGGESTGMENPLLRSGLALAGANRGLGAGGEDGILTAYEAAGLDLWGTKLVVLSACETGVGEVQNSEGVYGLRRALVLAGSESQVMTLWQVSDEATRDLMVDYYKRLTAGEGRTEALRSVQLEMLRGGGTAAGGLKRGLGAAAKVVERDYSHPYYWAAFIQSGDWRAMSQPAQAR
jgi:CHAT domain-containing protein/tetratricopeptide (TPR) repeat protein